MTASFKRERRLQRDRDRSDQLFTERIQRDGPADWRRYARIYGLSEADAALLLKRRPVS